eukprot:Clim_evm20s159 gene=Clim_evmTU20s159
MLTRIGSRFRMVSSPLFQSKILQTRSMASQAALPFLLPQDSKDRLRFALMGKSSPSTPFLADTKKQEPVPTDPHAFLRRAVENIQTTNAKHSFAVIYLQSHQYKVTEGDTIIVPRIPIELGEAIRADKVLLAGGKTFSMIGRPFLSTQNVVVYLRCIEHMREANKISFKMTRRSGRSRRRHGHRQDLSALKVERIVINAERVQLANSPKTVQESAFES